MMNLAHAALAVVAGVSATIQAATNAALARETGLGPTVIINTIVVAFASIGLWAAMGAQTTFLPAGTPWPLYLGGVFGFVIVASLTVVFPKIGAAYAIALMVGGQCIAALLVDHYGLIGMPREPLTLQRAVGAALVAAGVVVFRI
jgi:transporter family-2 protein